MIGHVAIVGAGPGAPDLLTVRGLRRLEQADLVLYDGLVPADLVALATRARALPVSRRPGDCRVPPAEAARWIIEAAKAGQRVVRLRAGDPFLLARGAEEALELVAAGVPFEVVPGLTTASAAPTLAGVPLTHRGVTSAVLVISGHAPEAYGPILASVPPHSVTVVVLMGLGERARLAASLIDAGWRASTPATVLLAAGHARSENRLTRLDRLRDDQSPAETARPGVIVIGDVVNVGMTIAAAMTTPEGAVEETVWQP